MQRDEIFSVIKQNIYEILEDARGKEIHEEILIREVGLDSLEAVEIISLSMKQLNIKIPLKALSDIKTIKQLIDLFVQYADQKAHEPAENH